MSTSMHCHSSQFQLANKYLIVQVKHAQNPTERYAQAGWRPSSAFNIPLRFSAVYLFCNDFQCENSPWHLAKPEHGPKNEGRAL